MGQRPGGLQNHPAGCDPSAARHLANSSSVVLRPKPWRRHLVKVEVAGATPVGTAIAEHSVPVRRRRSERRRCRFDSCLGIHAVLRVPVAHHVEAVKIGARFSGTAPADIVRAHRPTAGCRPRTAEIGVQVPVGPRSNSGRASEWDRKQAVILLSLRLGGSIPHAPTREGSGMRQAHPARNGTGVARRLGSSTLPPSSMERCGER